MWFQIGDPLAHFGSGSCWVVCGTDFELDLKLAGAETARSKTQDACQLEFKCEISSIHRNCQFGIIRGTDFELELQLAHIIAYNSSSHAY